MTRAERNIAWIESFCRVPEGRLVGKPVKLRDWQQDILKQIYDNPQGTRRAIISFGRKNGKTALCAFLLLLHLCGPEAQPNSQLFSAAQSREQAAVLFGLAAKMVRMSPDLDAVLTVRDTAKQLACSELGTLYRAMSAEASTAYGTSPVFVVHDELGQVRGPRSELYEALETGAAAHDAPLSVIISTQAPNPNDLLSVLIDDAKGGHDPRTVLALYEAPESDDPFAEETIRKANPAFGDFQNEREVMESAAAAKRMPSREAEYRNLILNQRVEVFAPFVSRGVWDACGGTVVEDFGGLQVFGGLDLSSTTDLTSLVYIAKVDGVWHVKPRFWLPADGLMERAQQDRQIYDIWHEQGFLETTPGPTVEYEYIAEQLFNDCETMNVVSIGFDRYNFKHLRPWLYKAGFEHSEIDPEVADDALFKPFGQGSVSMSPALRDLESDILQRKLVHGSHPVLNMCASFAVVTENEGGRKLNKAKSTGRIDGMVSLAMARGVAALYELQPVGTAYDLDPNFRIAG